MSKILQIIYENKAAKAQMGQSGDKRRSQEKGEKIEIFSIQQGGGAGALLVTFLFVSESKNSYSRQKRVFGKKKNNRQQKHISPRSRSKNSVLDQQHCRDFFQATPTLNKKDATKHVLVVFILYALRIPYYITQQRLPSCFLPTPK